MSEKTFEELLVLAAGIPLPQDVDERQVRWCDENRVVGLSRHKDGGYELFLTGAELHATSPLIRRHLKFDRWKREGNSTFEANRLVLPSDAHYVPVVAFLAEELLRSEITRNLAKAFARTEPLIELALRRLLIGDEALLGLLGELRFLDALLTVAENRPNRCAQALDSWRGHESGSRDFVLGKCSIEVKTTRNDASVHRVSSIMQVDPRQTSSGMNEEELYLLSLGFDEHDESHGRQRGVTLPEQVSSLLSKLGPSVDRGSRNALQELLITKIASYGTASGQGYDHDRMSSWSAYRQSWSHKFVRIYDMRDPAIKVLRRGDVQHCAHVVVSSISFEIDLPNTVKGDLNPQRDLFALARHFLLDSDGRQS